MFVYSNFCINDLALTSFLNMAMIAIRVSSLMPIQSSYLPLISLYFFLSLLYSIISLVWFLLIEKLKSKNYLPSTIRKFAIFFRKGLNKIHANKSNSGQIELNVCFSILNKMGFILMFLTMFISFTVIWSVIAS